MEETIIMVKFNKKICEEIIENHRKGSTIEHCAALSRIHRTTMYKWLTKGKETTRNNLYKKFYLGMQEARAKYIMQHLQKIEDSKDWKAHKYLLEVNDPDTYLLERKLNVKSDENVKVKIDNDEELFKKLDEEYFNFEEEE